MKKLILVTGFAILAWSCSNKDLEPVVMTNSSQKHSGARIPTTYLDWEHLDRYPAPGGGTIAAPWGTLVGNQFNDQIRYDYKQSDGWVLLYNTFNADGPVQDPLLFMLYNRYRGVIRIYDYVKPNAGLIKSDNLVHTFKLTGVQSNLLAYSGKEIVDINEKPSMISQVESFEVSPEHWYACEFELAYDPNLSTLNYQSLRFDWNFQGKEIDHINLNGNVNLKGTGTFSAPSQDLTISSPSITVNKSSNITHGAAETKTFLQTIGSSLAEGFSEGLTGIASKAVDKLFNMLTGTSDDKSSVNLDINGTIDLAGSINSQFLVANYSFAFPGYSQDNTTNYSPYTNDSPGVFTLSAKPVITRQEKEYNNRNTKYAIYTVDKSSFNIVINPAIHPYADIVDQEKLIVWNKNRETTGGGFYQDGGAVYEAGPNTYTADDTILIGFDFNGEDLDDSNFAMYVKVSFKVVPKDGSPTVYIVKTFVPDFVINNTPYTGPYNLPQ